MKFTYGKNDQTRRRKGERKVKAINKIKLNFTGRRLTLVHSPESSEGRSRPEDFSQKTCVVLLGNK